MAKRMAFFTFCVLLYSNSCFAQPLPSQACPFKLGVPNGDWEQGITAPWYVPVPRAGDPNVSVISPGYESNHALRLSVAKSNSTNFSFINPSIGEQCAGYFYRVKSALNWGNYTGPPSTDQLGCKLTIQSSYCYGNVVGTQQHYALPSSEGWNDYSFTCRAMRTGQATFTLDFSCSGNETHQIPAFQFDVDNLEINLLQNSF